MVNDGSVSTPKGEGPIGSGPGRIRRSHRSIVRRRSPAPPPQPTPDRRFLPALAAVALLITMALGTLPFVLGSMRDEVAGQRNERYDLRSGALIDSDAAAAGNTFNVAIVDLDEVAGTVTLAVSGNRFCADNCPEARFVFLALDESSERRGIAPFARITVAQGEAVFSERVVLPISGMPSRYPFDAYHLRLGVGSPLPNAEPTAGESAPSDVSVTPAPIPAPTSPAAGAGQIAPTLQNQLPGFVMDAPRTSSVGAVLTEAFGSQQVLELTFRRPTYLSVLCVLLIVLMAASAGMSLLTQPIDTLVLGVGGLILAVWGVRSVLAPQALPVVTAVDLALMLVIMTLLLGMALRVVRHLRRRAGVRLPDLPPPRAWRR